MTAHARLIARRLALASVLLVLHTAADAQEQPKVEIVPFAPHAGVLSHAAVSRDGAHVVTSGMGTVKLWDVATRRLLRTFEGQGGTRDPVAFSPNGTYVLAGGGTFNGTMKLWEAATGRLVRTFGPNLNRPRIVAGVDSVAFSPDGKWVLSGGLGSEKIHLWETESGQLIRTFQGQEYVSHELVAFSPDGTRVLAGCDNGTLRLWDATSGELVRVIKAHRKGITAVAFSPDGTRLLSAGESDEGFKLWDATSGQLLRGFEGHPDPKYPILSTVYSLAFSPDGRRVLSGGNRTVKLWEADSGELIRTMKGHGTLKVLLAAFSPDGTRLFSASQEDTSFRLWDAATGQPILPSWTGRSDGLLSVALSPDGSRMVSSAYEKRFRLWDTATGQLIRTFEVPDDRFRVFEKTTGSDGHIASVALSRDGRRALSFDGPNGILSLWDATSGQIVRNLDGDPSTNVFKEIPDRLTYVFAVFSPDSARVLSANHEGTFKVWDAATGRMIRTIPAHLDPIKGAVFSGNGTRLISTTGSGDNVLRLRDVASGQPIRTFEEHTKGVSSVTLSYDGTRVLSGGYDNSLRLWDAASGQLLHAFTGHTGPVQSVALSPDGRHVASGSWDYTIKLWDTASGQLVRTLEGHSGWVHSLTFTPDGTRVISAGSDATVRIWDNATGEQLAMLVGSRNGNWLAITPQGFFNAAAKGGEMLSLVRGLDITTIDQVHQSLFNPDLVREMLAGDPDGEVREAAKVINLEKVLDSGPAPDVRIEPPGKHGEAVTDVISVTARIEDRGKGVGRIEWRVNGITAAVAVKPEGRGPVYTVSRQLALDPGDNIIEVVAYNGSNLLASPPARATATFAGPADKAKPKLHILAIGINAYEDRGWTPPGSDTPRSFGPLGLAVKDATAFADSMKQAAAGLYDEVRVTLALDRNATRDNLDKLVDKMAAEVHPRDSFVLFAAAHGDAEKGRFYLIPQDYQNGPPGTLARRAIGQDDLQDWLANRIKARKAIVLLDTCESGALIAGHRRSRVDSAASEAGVGRLHEATGRPVLTATAAGQQAGEGVIAGSREGHGYFTWAVLDALHHGDSNGNGLIELTELAAHVQTVVPKVAAGIVVRAAAPEAGSAKQAARFGSRGEDFAVARRLR
jgi:WD40 repeat protein/uncharacterized caspase-like protein